MVGRFLNIAQCNDSKDKLQSSKVSSLREISIWRCFSSDQTKSFHKGKVGEDSLCHHERFHTQSSQYDDKSFVELNQLETSLAISISSVEDSIIALAFNVESEEVYLSISSLTVEDDQRFSGSWFVLEKSILFVSGVDSMYHVVSTQDQEDSWEIGDSNNSYWFCFQGRV